MHTCTNLCQDSTTVCSIYCTMYSTVHTEIVIERFEFHIMHTNLCQDSTTSFVPCSI